MTPLSWTLIAIVLVALIGWRAFFWYKEGRKLQKDGYLPPNPTFVGQLTLKLVSWIMCFRAVGPVKVMNRKNTRFKGRLNILPNHQFELDFMTVGKALPYGYRHLGSRAQMSNPILAMLAAFAGFFSANTDGGKAKTGGSKVVEMLGKVLALHPRARLLMFQQGTLVRDNVLRTEEFRTGAVRALQSARDEEGIPESELAVLPVAIKYLREPEHRSWYHRLMNKLGRDKFRWFRMHGVTTKNCGAIVNFGKPIPLSDLPEDAREATGVIRLAIQSLLDEIEETL